MELLVNNVRLHTSPFTKSWAIPFSDFVSLLVTNVIMNQGSQPELIDTAETSFLKMYQSWVICEPEQSPPWDKLPTDIENARKFFSIFFDSLNKFLELTHYVGMTKLWRFLTMDTRLIAYAPTTHIHIQDTIFDALNNSKIQWVNWYPILEDVEYIVSLIQYVCALPQEEISQGMITFLCTIACSVRWENRDFMGDYRIVRFQELFIRWIALSLLCKQVHEDLRRELSSRSLEMDWNQLSVETYSSILNDIIGILTKIRSTSGFEAGVRCNNMIKFLSTTCGSYASIEDNPLEEKLQIENQKHSISLSMCVNRFYLFVKFFVASMELGLPTQEFSRFAIRGVISVATSVIQNTLANQALEELFKLLNKSKTRELVSDGLNKSLETHPGELLSILAILFKAVTVPSTLAQEGENVISTFVSPNIQAKLHNEEMQKLWEDVMSSIPSTTVEIDNIYLPLINAATAKGAGLFLFALTQKLILRSRDFNPGTMFSDFIIPKGKEHIFILVVFSVLEKVCNDIREDPNNERSKKTLLEMGNTLSSLSLDKKKEGISGMFGFGEASEYTASFRLFAKLTSLFIQVQIMNNGKIRSESSDPHENNYTSFKKSIKQMSYILKNKSYTSEMKPNIMSDILNDFEHLLEDKNTTIKSYNQVLHLLIQSIYPNKLELIMAFNLIK